MSTSGLVKTLAFPQSALGKVGQDARAFRRASRSGVPLPARWTFASALVASAHCLDAALRPPGFACVQSSLADRGTPDLVDAESNSGSEEPKRLGSPGADSSLNSPHRFPLEEAGGFRRSY